MTVDVEREKRLAAEAAAALVRDGMRVGLGTGSTVQYVLEALARDRRVATFIASSPRTERAARALGITIAPTSFDVLDLALDGADQIADDGWLIKGGGGAHTREKLLAASAERFVVVADSSKLVPSLRSPVPLELLAFGVAATVRRIGPVELRDAPRSPDGGVIADYVGVIEDPRALAQRLSATPGVVEHGLFGPQTVAEMIIGVGTEVRTRTGANE